jgi:hypothetical protein
VQPICSCDGDGSGDNKLLRPDDINRGAGLETKVGKGYCCRRKSTVNKAISYGHHRDSRYSYSAEPDLGRAASQEYGMVGFGSLHGGTAVSDILIFWLNYLLKDGLG